MPQTAPTPDLLHQRTDRTLLGVLAALLVLSVGVAATSGGGLAGALLTAVLLAGLSAFAVTQQPGTVASRLVLAAALMGGVALLIHVTHGRLESHFGVFVGIAILAAYRDWRPLVCSAGVIAVHHVAFAVLQARGVGVHAYPHTATPWTVVEHALYVVVETAVLVLLARHLDREFRRRDGAVERAEAASRDGELLRTLLGAVGRMTSVDEAIRASLDAVATARGLPLAAYRRPVRGANGTKTLELAQLRPEGGALATAARAWQPSATAAGFSAALKSGELTVIPCAELYEESGMRDAARLGGGVAVALVPVFAHGKVAGVFEFLLREPALTAEQGDALRAVAQLISNIIERLDLAEREAKAQAEQQARADQLLLTVEAAAGGDLTQDVTVTGEDAMGRIGTALERLLAGWRERVASIAEAAEALSHASATLNGIGHTLASGAEQTTARAGDVASTVGDVSHAVGTVAVSADELRGAIGEIAARATEAARAADDAVARVTQADATVARLGASSEEIGKVVKLITSIAEQTNLLALNATIEAARAGEAGKGFAVVANEVKELAKQTAGATEDISRRIEAIQTDTTAAVDAIRRIGAVVGDVSALQTAIAAAVEEQSAVTAEITRSADGAAEAATRITQSIDAVAADARTTSDGARENTEAAASLASVATRLRQLVESLRWERTERSGRPAVGAASQRW